MWSSAQTYSINQYVYYQYNYPHLYLYFILNFLSHTSKANKVPYCCDYNTDIKRIYDGMINFILSSWWCICCNCSFLNLATSVWPVLQHHEELLGNKKSKILHERHFLSLKQLSLLQFFICTYIIKASWWINSIIFLVSTPSENYLINM